jgi:hypothetical protein
MAVVVGQMNNSGLGQLCTFGENLMNLRDLGFSSR